VEPVRAADELTAHVEEIERRMEGKSKAISTGYPALDGKLSGGLRGGDLIVLAGRPKMGKTALALNIGTNVAEHYPVLVKSMEMPKSQLHDRNLASLGRIPLQHLLEPATMADQDWAGLTHASIKISEMQLYLDDKGGQRLIDVRMDAKSVKRKHGLKLLIVDYLQLMEGDGDNRNAQIEGITRGLKALAKELDISIILLSQLNRKLEERPNKRPIPSDLRDSGSIEQDADAVIFLYRDEVYNPDSPDIGMCEVDVALCRQGAPGRVALTYIGEQVRFESLNRSWMPAKPAERSRPRGLAAHL
jgi:replicative DNA helicase